MFLLVQIGWLNAIREWQEEFVGNMSSREFVNTITKDLVGISKCSTFFFINGEPVLKACCRTNVGGYHVTNYLKQLLSLKYPHHMSRLTWEKVEDLKMEHCYITPGFAEKLIYRLQTVENSSRPLVQGLNKVL